MVRTVVHVLRHGEVHNPEGVLYGRLPDYHLSDAGRAMAEKAAAALADEDLVEVVASPLERAQETAAPIARRHGLDVGTDPRIIEAGNQLEGRKFSIKESLTTPADWSMFRNPLTPSWGEPYDDIAERMSDALADARDRVRGHASVLVSHQLPIWTLRRFAEGRRLWHNPAHRQCSLASLTSFVFEDRALRAVVYTEPAAELARGKAGTGA